MSTKVTLKKSSVQGKVPSASDLDYGELAVNYTDGRIYYKTSLNSIKYFERINSTDDLAEGFTNRYYSNSLVDNHLSAGTGVSYSSGTISIGQDVSPSSDVTFNSVSGDGSGLTNLPSQDSSVQTSDIPPSSPSDGTLWWDSSEGNLYVYYVDNDSSQWVSATATTAGPKGETGEGVPDGGNEGQILRKASDNDYDTEWVSDNYNIVTIDYVAKPRERILADTTTQSWTLTLPESPSAGNYIIVADGNDWSINNLIASGNGETIEGSSEDLTFDVGGYHVTLIYDGTTWRVFM